NQVLMRSINTSLTTLLPVGSLLFVGSILLGADTLKDLALALFVGIASGTYSSIFVATPLLSIWKEREPRYLALRRKALREGREAVEAPPTPAPAARTTEQAEVLAEEKREVALGVGSGSRPVRVQQRRPSRAKRKKGRH
ncbi:MAG: protein translocase subunit SecF, partial [Candidatus Methylomirabilales bacterium]